MKLLPCLALFATLGGWLSCKPIVREESSSPQMADVVRLIKRYIINRQFNKARKELDRLFEDEKVYYYGGTTFTDTVHYREFLASYVQQEMKDVDNIVAKISASDEMPAVLSMLRSMLKELQDIKAARVKRARATLAVFNDNRQLLDEVNSQWSDNFARWRDQIKHKLTRAVNGLLADTEYTGKHYPRQQDFDKAKGRIENILQKVSEAFQ